MSINSDSFRYPNSFFQSALNSPSDFAKEISFQRDSQNQKLALAQKIHRDHADKPFVKKVAELNSKLNSLKPNEQITLTQKDLLACVEYALLSIATFEQDPIEINLQAIIIEKSKKFINKQFSKHATCSLTQEQCYNLMDKVNSFARTHLTGKPQEELHKGLKHEAERDHLFNQFLASHDLADTILDLLTDPSKLEMTFSQFITFCTAQSKKTPPRTPTQEQQLAFMEAELADLLPGNKQKTNPKANKDKKISQTDKKTTEPGTSKERQRNLSDTPTSTSARGLNNLSPSPLFDSDTLTSSITPTRFSSEITRTNVISPGFLADSLNPSNTAQFSPLSSSAAHTHSTIANSSPGSIIQKGSELNPSLNRSFAFRSSLERSSQSPPLTSFSTKKGVHFDPNFDNLPGVKKVLPRENRRSASKQGYEDFLSKILNNPATAVSTDHHVMRWGQVQNLEEVRAFKDLSLKGNLRYAEMKDPQIKEQILHHDATSIDSLLQSDLFRKHYTKSATDRHYLLKVKLEVKGKPAPQDWTIATAVISKKQELVHFYCHDIRELTSNHDNANESLVSKLFPVIETFNLQSSSPAAQSTPPPPKTHHAIDSIVAIPQEKGPPILKILRKHPLTGSSTLFIAPIK